MTPDLTPARHCGTPDLHELHYHGEPPSVEWCDGSERALEVPAHIVEAAAQALHAHEAVAFDELPATDTWDGLTVPDRDSYREAVVQALRADAPTEPAPALAEPADGATEVGEHRYLSTGCYHGHHEQCRLTCKWCPAECACSCHVEQAEVDRG